MGNQAGKKEGKPESESGREHRGSHCEAETGRKERKKQRLSSQNPKLKQAKASENSGGQKVDGKKLRKRSGKKLSPEKPESES